MNDVTDPGYTRLASCPPWCAEHDFHPAISPADDGEIGHYSKRWLLPTPLGGAHPVEVFASMFEYGDQLDEATVLVNHAEGMTAAQCRVLAAVLLEAADLLDGGQR